MKINKMKNIKVILILFLFFLLVSCDSESRIQEYDSDDIMALKEGEEDFAKVLETPLSKLFSEDITSYRNECPHVSSVYKKDRETHIALCENCGLTLSQPQNHTPAKYQIYKTVNLSGDSGEYITVYIYCADCITCGESAFSFMSSNAYQEYINTEGE